VDDALVLIRLGLAAVFIVAGTAKLIDRSGSRDALADFAVPDTLAGPLVLLLPAAELAAAVALLFAGTARWGGLAAVALLCVFVAGLARALRRGDAPDCHCFGQVHSEPASWATVSRNVALAGPAGFLAVAGPGPALTTWVDAHSAQALWLIATSSVAALASASCLVLWRRNRQLRAAGPSKPVTAPRLGGRAPRFSLPSVGGPPVALQDLLADDRPCLLTFVSRGCGPCAALLPEIARWHDALADRVRFAVVSIGDAELAGELAQEYGLAQVLADPESLVSRAYGVAGTPSSVLVGPDGLVESAPTAGAVAIEALVRVTLKNGSVRPFVVHHGLTDGLRPA
jgi:peroxiredoxin/uncharacterized membrane protein YphA (DoxX/SURF4 family)